MSTSLTPVEAFVEKPDSNGKAALYRSDTEIEKEDPTSLPWWSLFYQCSQDTSMHGVRFTTMPSRFTLRRLLWIVLTTGTACVFIYYLYDRVSFYLLFLTNVDVAVNYIDAADFPAVTLCNRNQFKLSSAVDGGYYSEVVNISRSPIAAGQLSCFSGEIQCDNKCILPSRLCDGVPDCKDGSDEGAAQCGVNRCNKIKITGADVNSKYNGIINHEFQRDFTLDSNGRPVYFTMSQTAITYLVYINDSWVFSTYLKPDWDQILLTTGGNASEITRPDQYTGLWVDGLYSTSLTLICKDPTPELQNIPMLATSPVAIHTMTDIYDYGAHTLRDVIQSCTWKGRSCNVSDFKTVDTDSGRCFTYKPTQQIEQSGPGFGLGFTVNIQLYEYTRSSDDPVGIQILLHNPKDPPVMAEKSFAVSAGLSTLVAVESTEVENLAHPWGKCEQRKLDYYEKYSVSSCNLDCFNQIARDTCQCRDLYMPEALDLQKLNRTAGYPYCSVNEYLNCWKPKLDQLRMSGNYCSCGTPCQESIYVPGLSFSSINSDTSYLKGKELQKMLTIQENLIRAREISYRITEEKYMETMRMFSTTITKAALTSSSSTTTADKMATELNSLQSVTAKVNADCLWFMKEQHNLIQVLETDLINVIDELYVNVRGNVYNRFGQLVPMLNKVYECGYCGYTSYMETWKELLDPWYMETDSRLEALKNDLRARISANITSILNSVTFPYTLNDVYIVPLLPYMRANCNWCLSGTTTLQALLLAKLTTAQDAINTQFTALRLAFTNFHTSSKNGVFLSYTSTTKTNFINSAGDFQIQANTLMQKIESTLKNIVVEAVSVVKDLERLLTPKCDTDLRRLYLAYTDQHDRMKLDLEKVKQIVFNYGSVYMDYQQKYKAYKFSLTELSGSSNFTQTQTDLQTLKVQLESRFTERQVAIEKLKQQTGIIYYWFYAQIPEATIASSSALWTHLGMSSPSLVTGTLSSVTGGVAIQDTYSFDDPALTNYWNGIINNLITSGSGMSVGLSNMQQKLTESENYLTTYVAGNEISPTVYQQNFLQVDIFYKELTSRSISQQKAYEYPTLLGEVGGIMGLLLGISLMTVFEFVDLIFYNAIGKCIAALKRGNQVQTYK